MTNVLCQVFSLDDLKAVVKEVLLEVNELSPKGQNEKKYIHGLDGLATFLKCSRVSAQRYKSSGLIPYSQTGRKIVFEEAEVLKAMQKKGGIVQ